MLHFGTVPKCNNLWYLMGLNPKEVDWQQMQLGAKQVPGI